MWLSTEKLHVTMLLLAVTPQITSPLTINTLILFDAPSYVITRIFGLCYYAFALSSTYFYLSLSLFIFFPIPCGGGGILQFFKPVFNLLIQENVLILDDMGRKMVDNHFPIFSLLGFFFIAFYSMCRW